MGIKIKKLSTDRGFTVLEMLIVIAVIGTIAAIVYTGLGGANERTYFKRAEVELATIGNSAKLYAQKYDVYPPDGPEAGIPSEIREFIHNQNYNESWPDGPWPGSLYDWDAFDLYPVDGTAETFQVSIRFCTYAERLAPGGPALCQSRSPKQPWAASFNSNDNAVYYCVKGYCRPNGQWTSTTFPSYCVNCPGNLGVKYPGEV